MQTLILPLSTPLRPPIHFSRQLQCSYTITSRTMHLPKFCGPSWHKYRHACVNKNVFVKWKIEIIFHRYIIHLFVEPRTALQKLTKLEAFILLWTSGREQQNWYWGSPNDVMKSAFFLRFMHNFSKVLAEGPRPQWTPSCETPYILVTPLHTVHSATWNKKKC